MNKVKAVEAAVEKHLDGQKQAHGFDHAKRVYRLAMKFAETEKADRETVALAALLHDVDDYKFVSAEDAENLTNAKRILAEANIDGERRKAVLDIIANMGYSKLLAGKRPSSPEGKVVSDADMCDGIGATGIVRMCEFDVPRGQIFFNPEKMPKTNLSAKEYKAFSESSSTDHFFVKLLRIKGLMMTESGRVEASSRHDLMVDFLRQFFAENDEPKWSKYLEDYLQELEK